MNVLRGLAGRFTEISSKVQRLATSQDVSCGHIEASGPAAGACETGVAMLDAAIKRAMPLADDAKVDVLAQVARALPQHCSTPRNALRLLEQLQEAIRTVKDERARFHAAMHLGALFSDTRFGDLVATTGSERFFHSFSADLDALAYGSTGSPTAPADAFNQAMVRDNIGRLATWSGLMATSDTVAIEQRAPLLENFSRILPKLSSIDEKSRGFDCLLKKTPGLPTSSRIIVVDNLSRQIGTCTKADRRLQAFERVADLTAAFGPAVHDRMIDQLASQVPSILMAERDAAFATLLDHASRMGRSCSPQYLCKLVATIGYLPSARARGDAWIAVSRLLNGVPSVARAEPVIALIDSIELLAEDDVRADRLGMLVPLIIAMERDAHNTAIQHVVEILKHIPGGAARAKAVAQAMLLMVNESEPQVVAHLHCLLGLMHYCTAEDDGPALLQAIAERARSLSGPGRCRVLESMVHEFGAWQDKEWLKPAVMIIARESNVANPTTQARLSVAITDGLLAVAGTLQGALRSHGVSPQNIADVTAWLKAAAIAPGPGRADVIAAASDLVETAWRSNPAQAQLVLEAYGRQFSPAMQDALTIKLGN